MIGLDTADIHALTNADRAVIADILGLNRFSFRVCEKVGAQTLRSWLVSEGGTQADFPSPTTEGEISDCPVLVRSHLSSTLAESPAFPVRSLWDELLPFPISAWGAPTTVDFAGATESDCRDWWDASVLARAAFDEFQMRLFSAEISVVRLADGLGQEILLFFHAVRRRFLEQGRLVPFEDVPVGDFSGLKKHAASFQYLDFIFPKREFYPEQLAEIGSQLRHSEANRPVCMPENAAEALSAPFPL